MEEAWERIFNMKNTEKDLCRLQKVKKAMKEGRIGRRPSLSSKKKFSKAEALRLYDELQEIEKEEKIKELIRKTPKNYFLINNMKMFNRLLEVLKEEDEIALDTETTGIDVYRDEIVGISITLPKKDIHVYIPLKHKEVKQLNFDYVLEKLKPLIENANLKKVLHNAKFDIHIFLKYGIRLQGLLWDTMVAMHLLNENEPSFALKNLATKYLKVDSDTYEALFGKTGFQETPLNIALLYAAKDTDLTWQLYQFQKEHFNRLPKLKKLYEDVENPLIDIAVDMEQAGFKLDIKEMEKLKKELEEKIQNLRNELYSHYGLINLNSPAQLRPAIEGVLDQNISSTSVHVLKKIKNKHISISKLLDYREYNKLLTTYVEALPKELAPDNKIHPTFNQIGTVTGRFASRDPNLQNQPNYIRKVFLPPKDQVILSADFSQQEPRFLAHFSQEPLLLKAYKEDKDLYTIAAAELFEVPEEECLKGSSYRQMMKMGILAVMYGIMPKTLAGQLGITEAEAEIFIKTFFKKYPKVKQWVENNKKFLRKNGYVEMMFGRKRRIPKIKSTDRWDRYRAERQATNAIIQGSSAIQTKLTMLAIDKFCKRKGDEWKMCLQVHDEIGIYAPITFTRKDVEEIEDIVLNTVKLSVPNKTEIEIFLRWGEGYTADEWDFENHKPIIKKEAC